MCSYSWHNMHNLCLVPYVSLFEIKWYKNKYIEYKALALNRFCL